MVNWEVQKMAPILFTVRETAALIDEYERRRGSGIRVNTQRVYYLIRMGYLAAFRLWSGPRGIRVFLDLSKLSAA